MFPHPTITAALAEQHRRDLTARAEAHRLARAVRSSRPVPTRDTAGPVKLVRQLVAAARRTAMRLPLVKVPRSPFSRCFRRAELAGQFPTSIPQPPRSSPALQETSCLTPSPDTSSHPPLPVPARSRLR